MQRGLILTTVDIQPGVISNLDPVLVRNAVLYWDKVAFAETPGLQMRGLDEEFLLSSGFAASPTIDISEFVGLPVAAPDGSLDVAKGMLAAQEILLSRYNKTVGEEDCWAIGRKYPCENFLPGSCIKNAIIEFELNEQLPVPPKDMPLEELFEFKRKYGSELLRMRVAMDDLYEDVIGANSLNRAKTKAVSELQSAILDMKKCAEKPFGGRLAISTKGEYLLSNAAPLGAAYMAWTHGSPTMGLLATTAAIVASGVKISLGSRDVFAGIPERSKNFEVLYHLEKNFPGTL